MTAGSFAAVLSGITSVDVSEAASDELAYQKTLRPLQAKVKEAGLWAPHLPAHGISRVQVTRASVTGDSLVCHVDGETFAVISP